jgi:hypothetical protein
MAGFLSVLLIGSGDTAEKRTIFFVFSRAGRKNRALRGGTRRLRDADQAPVRWSIRLVAGAACCTGTGEAGAVTEAIES